MKRKTIGVAFTLVLGTASAATGWLWLARAPILEEGSTQRLRAELERMEAERGQLREELQALRWALAAREEPVPCPSEEVGRAPAENRELRSLFARVRERPEPSLEELAFAARRRYGQLFAELALSPEQSDRLLQVIALQDQRTGAARRSDSTLASSAADRAEIAAVIGAEKAEAFERLERSLPSRAELRRVRSELEELGASLSEAQYQQLLAAVSERPLEDPPTQDPDEPAELATERLRTWFAERDARFRERAAGILTPAQVERLEESEAVRSAMMPALASRGLPQAGAGGLTRKSSVSSWR